MTTLPSPLCRRHRQPVRLGLHLALGLLLATVCAAVDLPQINTPWDVKGILSAGVAYSQPLGVTSPGSGQGLPVFSCTGLPPGLTLNKTTGVISGTAVKVGAYTVTSRVAFGALSSPAAVRRVAVISAHIPEPGVYEHLFDTDNMAPLGGHLSVLVQPSGAYSGTLRLATRTLPLAGAIRTDEENDRSMSNTFKIPNSSGALIKAAFIHQNGQVDLCVVDPQTGGPLATLGAITLVVPSTGPLPSCPQAGRHGVGLRSSSEVGIWVGAGAGFGSLTLGTDYRLTFVGRTAEGREVTASGWSFPVGDGTVSTHFYACDSGTTILWGTPTIPSPAKGYAEISWSRLPQKGWQGYPEGISNQRVQFITSRMSPQRMAQAFPAGSYNLNISMGPAAPGLVEQIGFQLTAQKRASFGPPASNPFKARVDIYAPTGLFTGRCTLEYGDLNGLTQTTTLQFRGLLLPDQGIGIGQFITPIPLEDATRPYNSTNAPLRSGLIEITPQGL